MNRIGMITLGIVVVALAITVSSSIFVVHQTKQVLVLQFGEPIRVVTEPGLKFKVPIAQDVVEFDIRVLNLDPPSEEVILTDQKRIIVDAFARYRIVDTLKYYQSVRNEATFIDRFGRVLNSSVRAILGESDLTELLSDKRSDIMDRIYVAVAAEGQSYGIEIVDVRIGRTELPQDVLTNVYDRMRSEREREANLLRAEGEENARRIRAEADRARTVILAEAERESSILRGEGEASRNLILGEAYGRDQEFFDFYRTLDAYRLTFLEQGTTLVLSPESDFFRYFNDGNIGGPAPASPALGALPANEPIPVPALGAPAVAP